MSSIRTAVCHASDHVRRMSLAIAVGILSLESSALAQVPPKAPPAASTPRPRRPRSGAPAEPALSAVAQEAIRLTIDAPTPKGPWAMRIVNEGSVPVRLAADARLLSLDVTRRGALKAERCELPPDMRPEDPAGRSLVLLPARAYVESFEPRLYCFAGKALDALSPTSIVVAHLGWLSKGSTEWAISPIDGIAPEIARQKHLDSAPIFLHDEKLSFGQGAPEQREFARFALEAPASVEADSPDEVALPVTLRNVGTRAALVRFRPDTMGFEVFSPSGRELCVWPRPPAAPTPEIFTRLPPGGSTQMIFTLAAFCNEDSLDRDGLLVVRPWLDTRAASGQNIGISAFSGWVSASAPSFVRLHRGRHPPTRVPPELAPQ
jgi:hypothetical protein